MIKFLLAFLVTSSAIAADRPPNPAGVFTCNGYSNTSVTGSGKPISDPYQAVLHFPSSTKEKFKLKAVTPLSYTAKGAYSLAEEKYWERFHIKLQPVPKIQIYRQVALKTCRYLGWQCIAKTRSSIRPSVKIMDDSHLFLTMMDFTDIKAYTPQGKKSLTMDTYIWGDCIKN